MQKTIRLLVAADWTGLHEEARESVLVKRVLQHFDPAAHSPYAGCSQIIAN
jgi:hypothetical protein